MRNFVQAPHLQRHGPATSTLTRTHRQPQPRARVPLKDTRYEPASRTKRSRIAACAPARCGDWRVAPSCFGREWLCRAVSVGSFGARSRGPAAPLLLNGASMRAVAAICE